MGKRRAPISEKRLADYIKAGYAECHGKDYKSWLEIQDLASIGTSSRVPGWKTKRSHHCMSNLEIKYFYLIEWSDEVVDIREQYPLLDIDTAMKIADRKGIRYPCDIKTGLPFVLTTDFMITVKRNGCEIDLARTVKPSSELEKKRVIEKFEIERCYWEEMGVDWGIVTEKEISEVLAGNLAWLYHARNIESDASVDMAEVLKNELAQSPENSLRDLLERLDAEYCMEPGSFLKIFKHLVSCKVIAIDLNKRPDISRKLSDII